MRTVLVLFCLAGGLNAERVSFAAADGKKISMEFHRGTDSAAILLLAETKKAKALQPPVAEWKRLGVAIAVRMGLDSSGSATRARRPPR